MKDFMEAPLKLAQQTGVEMPQQPTEMDTQDDAATAPGPKADPAPSKVEDHDEKRAQLSAAIIRYEKLIGLLDPNEEPELIAAYKTKIENTKQLVTGLKPLQQRIEQLQNILDGQETRIKRANTVISNWETLRDGWQQKYDRMKI